jgi:hypothetical protein
MKTKILLFAYRIIFPMITIISLFYFSEIDKRNIFFHSKTIDFFARLFLCLFFCLGYINMPFITKSFRTYKFPSLESTKLVIYPGNLFLSIGMTIIRLVIIAVFTNVVISVFLPQFIDFSYIISIINGLIYSLPAIAQYIAIKKELPPYL